MGVVMKNFIEESKNESIDDSKYYWKNSYFEFLKPLSLDERGKWGENLSHKIMLNAGLEAYWDGDNNIDKEASIEFLESLTDIIEELNIAILNIKPQKKVTKGKYTYIPYDLDIRCSYEQFGKLINALETNDRLIQIDEFKLQNNVKKVSNRKGLNNLMNHNIEMKISTISINK